MDIYQQNILDYYRRPRKQGKLAETTHVGAMANPLCGDRIELYLEVAQDKIVSARWDGEGCVLSLVAADMMAEDLEGKALEELAGIDKNWILKKLGVKPSPSRQKCAFLSLEALDRAILNINHDSL
ncbi:MAG TPA: iron-sulfur cluster assembly scaffold protein [Patescibacteria group bacterium]|nr:iron-sulfur cluster assembly scaffold protein [Patescibacteria group bacterium]